MSRRSDLDKGSVTGGLINEAYDEVKRVADNIDEIIKVADNLASLSAFSVSPLLDAGDGTVSGDMNATDWTGHEHADTNVLTALKVELTEALTVVHKGIIYNYRGSQPILLGVGGSSTLDTDYGEVGYASDHSILTNRTAPDAHPMSSITGLEDTLALTVGSYDGAGNSTASRRIPQMVRLTQAEYNAISVVDVDTFYVIV